MLREPAIRVEREALDISDLILLGLLGGEWLECEDSILLALDLQAAGAPRVSVAQLRERATSFRYARRLVSAAEFTTWLRERELTLDDLSGVLTRALVREGHSGEPPPRVAGQEQLPDILRAEALCAGVLETLARRGIELLAAADRLGDHRPVADDDVRVTMALPDALRATATGLPQLGEQVLRERLCALLGLVDARSRLLGEVAPPDQVARRIATHRLDWLWISGRQLTLPHEGAAREARMLLTEEHMAATEVAARAEGESVTRELYLDALPAELAGAFAAAAPGEVVGPWRQDDGWHVLLVIAKVAPSLSDRTLYERAAREILDDVLERHAAGRTQRLCVL